MSIQEFAAHNKKVFGENKPNEKAQSVILLELNNLGSAHIAYSYFARAMADLSGARLVAYDPEVRTHWSHWVFRQKNSLKKKKIKEVYESFGVAEFLQINPSLTRFLKAHQLAVQLKENIQTKRSIEKLKIKGIRIGDLLYDSYLKDLRRPTIRLESKEWFLYLRRFLNHFLFWEKFFTVHQVAAVNASHCVYELAIPLRMAVFRDVPAFQVNVTHAYRLGKKNLFAYNDFFNFPREFQKIPAGERKKGIQEAKKRIGRRFKGEVGVDMDYSKKSAFGKISQKKLLRKSSRKKILVATHCFFDSPHSYGDNVFPDFYEWLEFLGKISKKTNYEWYIKTHPDYLPGTLEIIQSFIQRYPRFCLLPPETSHHQIIQEGIDLALTVYGTIAFEYALLGVPVLNASRNNPHAAYSFNLHAGSAAKYKNLLLNPKTFHHKIPKSQVYEYYFMKHIFNTENIFFKNYEKAIFELGGYEHQFGPEVYRLWMNEWSAEKHELILKTFRRFFLSGDFRMNGDHLPISALQKKGRA